MPASILRQSPRKLVRTPSKPSRLTPLDQPVIPTDTSVNKAVIPTAKQLDSSNPLDVPADKKSLCLSLLTEGYIHSYTDFFYLTHKQEAEQPVNQSTNDSKSTSKDKADSSAQIPPLTSNELVTISNYLKQAEQADRSGDSISIIDCYTQLSKFFKSRREFRSAIYFSEKILEFTSQIGTDQSTSQPSSPENNQSTNSTNNQLQIESLSALTMLAELFAECGESSQSIAMYEKCSTLASDQSLTQSISQSPNPSLAATLSNAASQLTNAYCQHGDRLFTQGAFEEAAVFYDKCRIKAQQAGQSESEMIALYALGTTHTKLASINQNQSTRSSISQANPPLSPTRPPTHSSPPATPQNVRPASQSVSSSTSQPVSGNIKEAMSAYQQGLSIAKLLHHSAMIAELSLALADNYTLQNEQNLALNYLELAVYHAGHAMEKGAKQAGRPSIDQSTSSSTHPSTHPSAPSQVLTRSTSFERLFRGWQCMGEIHSRAQNHVQAAEMFEKSFELARKHDCQAMMDLARIHVGMARANVAMKAWMTLCQQPDVQDMLEFKAKRVWPEGIQPPKTAPV